MRPHRTRVKKSLRAIERAFGDLEDVVANLSKRVRAAERGLVGKFRPPRRTLRLTPKRRAQLKLQGAYMGYMRQLKPAQKARVKAVKDGRGVEAAIRVARRLANG